MEKNSQNSIGKPLDRVTDIERHTPIFSIIVPLYNKGEHVTSCLESIKLQAEESWECIIVNDGSTDKGREISELFAQEDSRFKVFSQNNSGPSAARNKGIKEAKGKLVHFMDADDYYPSPQTLESIKKVYLKYKPDAIAGNIGVKRFVDKPVDYSLDVNFDSIKYRTFRELQNDYFFTRFFFDREFLIENSITFPAYTRVGEDPVFLVKALSSMERFIDTNIPVYIYNQLASSNNALYEYGDEKLIGYMSAQIEILEICKKNNYEVLTKNILNRIDTEMIDKYMNQSAKSAEVRVLLESIIAFIDPVLYYERVVYLRNREMYITELENKINLLNNEIEELNRPSIKSSSGKLVGAVKRRAERYLRIIK